jgi:hypothetical protein
MISGKEYHQSYNNGAEKIDNVVEFWKSKGLEISKTPIDKIKEVKDKAKANEVNRILKDDWQ